MQGAGLLSAHNVPPVSSGPLKLRSDEEGRVQVQYFVSSPVGSTNEVLAAALTGGRQADVSFLSVTDDADLDEDDLGDNWERQWFGSLSRTPDEDEDLDGRNLYQEYQQGSSPFVFDVDGSVDLRIRSGNNQGGPTNVFLLLPFTVEVRGPQAKALTRAPIRFSLTEGAGVLRRDEDGAESASSILVRSDSYGAASIRFKPRSPPGTTHQIQVQVEGGNPGQHVTFLTLSTRDDEDQDGLPDAWELRYFGNLLQTGTGDPDLDGRNNLQELTRGTDPRWNEADTDFDGLPDLLEQILGSDPQQGFIRSPAQSLSFQKYRPSR